MRACQPLFCVILQKARGLKNISGMKKSDLVDLMVAEDERQGKRREYEAA